MPDIREEKGTQTFSVAVNAPVFCIGKRSLNLDQAQTTQSGKPVFDTVLKKDWESLSLGG